MRLDPTKTPHLKNKDSESPIPDGLRRGVIPKQRSFSVQDVRDYSTPQGAAMANEEMRRLVETLESISKDNTNQPTVQGKSITTQTPTVTLSVGQQDNNSNDNNNNGTPVEPQSYTVYHNGSPVNTKFVNRAIDFLDSATILNNMREVVFSIDASSDGKYETARIRGFVNSEPIYIERFTLDVVDINAAQNLDSTGKKYRIPKYHDVIHNLNNPIYSIYNLGLEYCIPDIEIMTDTIRVRSRISDNYDLYKPFLNTRYSISTDTNEYLGKLDNVEFLIIVKGTL